MHDVTTYGAVGNGTTDDRDAIQDAIDAAATAGGGVVYFPKGTYLLDSSHPVDTGFCLSVNADDIFLQGEGRGVSILKVGNNRDSACINFSTGSIRGGGISKLEIDGNRANQAGGHGIRGGGSIDGWTCRDVYIHDAYSYGIGFQYPAATENATYKNILFDNVLIEDTGLDGIDIKNPNDNNVSNRMNNVTVCRAGLRSDVTTQACIDLRGPWQLTNITCLEFNDSTNTSCQSGIRFRFGETGETGGLGAKYSTLTNFYVDSGSVDTETIGVFVTDYQVAISSGVILNTKTGMHITQQETTVSSVIAKGCNNGFIIDTGSPTNADRVVLMGCVARGCSDSGFKIYTAYTVLDGIIARSNVNGVNLRNGSSNTVISGVASGNTTNLNKQSAGLTWKDAGFIY